HHWRLGKAGRGLSGSARGRRHRRLVPLRAGAGLSARSAGGAVRRADHPPHLRFPKGAPRMFYREAGQFKTSYQADVAIFPIRQDRIAIALIAVAAFIVIPLLATPYVFTGILIPFLILALAAIGLNILTGYAGQLSLGTAAFMAVGAFASYNFMLRVPGMPILLAFIGAGT